MRLLMIILKVILTSFLLLILFVWLMAHGSGHNIPLKTDLKFGITTCILLVLLLFTIYWGKNKVAK
jgi:heme A synthase